MTRKTSSTIRVRSTQAPPLPSSSQSATLSCSSDLPPPILRPISDLNPGAPVYSKTAFKSSNGPFSSLTFAAGTAFGGGGMKKQRKGVLGFFHKKEGSEASSCASSAVSTSSSARSDSTSPESVSSGLPTPTSPAFLKIENQKLSKGTIGRTLRSWLTGTVREGKSSTSSVRSKGPKETLSTRTTTGHRVELAGTLSYAPPFPGRRTTKKTPSGATSRPSADRRLSADPKVNAPSTLTSLFASAPAAPRPARADHPRTLCSSGTLGRPPLGNIFLGPLSTSPKRPGSMDQVAFPEMALDGLEAIVASGMDSLRVRSMLRAEPRARLRSIADVLAAPSEDIPRQNSLSVINRANRTLLDLVARIDQSQPSSPEKLPVKASEPDLALFRPLNIHKKTKPAGLKEINTDSAQSLLFLRKPKSAGRRLVPKASRTRNEPALPPPPTVNVVMDKAGVAFSPGAAPIGFGQTFGAEQVVQSATDVDGQSDEEHPDTDVPEDLQEIISDREDKSSRGSGSWSDHAGSPPPTPALGLPLPPPPNRISPRRNAPLKLEVPPLRITSWHSRSHKSSDDTSASPSPERRDSSIFDFTGEHQQLNENSRASFFDAMHSAEIALSDPPVFPSMREQALAAADEVAILQYKTSKSSTSSGNSTPLGALNRNFKFGSRTPSQAQSTSPETAYLASTGRTSMPAVRISAPTPLPPDSPESEGAYDPTFGAISAEEAAEYDDVLPDESQEDANRFSFVSDGSVTRRGGRRSGHGDSIMSFASISSVGQVIHPGSRHPFSVDYRSSLSEDMLSPNQSFLSSESSRIRTTSDVSFCTQSSLGAVLNDNRMSANLDLTDVRDRFAHSDSGHRHTDSVDSVASTVSSHSPVSSDRSRHHRRSSSILDPEDVGIVPAPPGPPISLFNAARPTNWKAKRHSRKDSVESALSSRSSLTNLPRPTGRADWKQHRKQVSSADSMSSFTFGGRPGLGDRMFSPDQAVPLFPTSASPNGSLDDSFQSDSFQLESMLQEADARGARDSHAPSDSSDSMSTDECQTSSESAFPTFNFVHERQPSLDELAESVFGPGMDESSSSLFSPLLSSPDSSAQLFMDLTRLSLDSSSSSDSSARKPKFVPGHRSRPSGPSVSVHVQATIHEEYSDGPPHDGCPPPLSRSQTSTPATDFDFPSPIFLVSTDCDIVAFDGEPRSAGIIHGWRAWEHDAYFEYGRSQAGWMDTDHSMEEIATFTPPKKLSQVQDFIHDSARVYKRLSSSVVKHKRSSSLADSRLHASPYYVDPAPIVKPKVRTRASTARPTSIKTKFISSDVDNPPKSAILTSAKFAAFAPLQSARSSAVPTTTAAPTRPASPPPILATFAPMSPLKVPFLEKTVQKNVPEVQEEKESFAKKARRVSSNVRREQLGWGRRRTVDGKDSDEALAKAVASKLASKRSSLKVHRDQPAVLTKLRPASPDNKENIFAAPLVRPSVRPRAARTQANPGRPVLRA